LAANLTNQVRAIAEVATAVTQGDLTRSIQVDARGEVAELKDNINTMIGNLRLTTDRKNEQDWLKTNLARFTSMLQGQRDLNIVGKTLLSELVPLVGGHQGLIYRMVEEEPQVPYLKLLASYGNLKEGGYPEQMPLGGGFLGQCAVDMRRILVDPIPCGHGPDRLRPLAGAAALPGVPAGGLRRPDQGGHRAGLAHRFHSLAPRLFGATDHQHRHRLQQHRGNDADRSAAQAVTAARRRAHDPAEGAPAEK
jgi:hypothetical protein